MEGVLSRVTMDIYEQDDAKCANIEEVIDVIGTFKKRIVARPERITGKIMKNMWPSSLDILILLCNHA